MVSFGENHHNKIAFKKTRKIFQPAISKMIIFIFMKALNTKNECRPVLHKTLVDMMKSFIFVRDLIWTKMEEYVKIT